MEDSLTTLLSMLTAIPEVDLNIDRVIVDRERPDDKDYLVMTWCTLSFYCRLIVVRCIVKSDPDINRNADVRPLCLR